ncbi:MAG: SUMF1/EgtB/PvdO family nonheme iron enzyme, partial [Anaerolineales bacterium]
MELEIDANLTSTGKEIAERLLDTRRRELELIADLTEQQLIGPASRIIEPPIWELGHVGWFQDRWILQNLDRLPPADDKADSLYDSYNIPNVERWDLMFPSRGQTVEYITDILERIILRLAGRKPTEEEIYFYKLVLNHEEMHSETMHHIRQTFGYPAPNFSIHTWEPEVDTDFELHDIEIPGGVYCLGGTEGQPFIFDNEKWAHLVEIKPFRISAAPVTFAQYQQFVDEGGYLERSLWSDAGWAWR